LLAYRHNGFDRDPFIPAQHLPLDLHRNESWIGFGVRRRHNQGSWALPGSPAQKAAVAQSVLSGEGQQREPAVPVFSEDLSFLFGGEVASWRAGW